MYKQIYKRGFFFVKMPVLTVKHANYVAVYKAIVTKMLQDCFVRR